MKVEKIIEGLSKFGRFHPDGISSEASGLKPRTQVEVVEDAFSELSLGIKAMDEVDLIVARVIPGDFGGPLVVFPDGTKIGESSLRSALYSRFSTHNIRMVDGASVRDPMVPLKLSELSIPPKPDIALRNGYEVEILDEENIPFYYVVGEIYRKADNTPSYLYLYGTHLAREDRPDEDQRLLEEKLRKIGATLNEFQSGIKAADQIVAAIVPNSRDGIEQS